MDIRCTGRCWKCFARYAFTLIAVSAGSTRRFRCQQCGVRGTAKVVEVNQRLQVNIDAE